MSFSDSQPAEKKKSILLVEDEALIAMNEAAMLQKHGYHVKTAYTGKKAIETVSQHDVDLILMDIDLGRGKMDGTEAAQTILKKRDIPIVFLTSHAEKKYVEKVKTITNYGYVLKNSGEFVLIESIGMAFKLFHAKQNEKENRQRFSTIFHQASVGIAQVTPDGSFIDTNEKFCEITGYTKDELTCLTSKEITHREDLLIDQSLINDVLSGERDSFSIEKRYISKTGEIIWVSIDSSAVRGKDGTIQYVIGVVHDISARKKYEVILKQSREKYQALVDNSPFGLLEVDLDGNIITANKKVAAALGISISEMPGRNMTEFISAYFASVMKNLSETAIKCNRTEECVLEENGRYYRHIIVPMSLDKKTTVQIISIDITEQRQAEEKYRLIAESIDEVFWIVSPDWRKVYFVNPAYEKVFGKSVESLYQNPLSWRDSMIEEDRIRVQIYLEQKQKDDLTAIVFPEYRIRKPDGSIRWIGAKGSAVTDKKGTIRYVVGIAADITEYKESEARFTTVSEMVSDHVYEVSVTPDGSLKPEWSTSGSKQLKHLELKSNLQINDISEIPNLYHDDIPIFEDHLKKILSNQSSVSEYRVHMKNGEVRWLRDFSRPMWDEAEKRVTKIIGAAQDITDVKIQNDVLEKNEKKFRRIVETSIDGILILDSYGNILDANAAYCAMSGYTKEELVTMSSKDLEAKESPREVDEHTKRIREQQHGRFESIHRKKDGTEYPVEVSSTYIASEELLLAFIRDISRRKKEEEELKYKNALLTAENETTIDGVLVVDPKDRIILYNRRFVDMWHLSPDVMETGTGDEALESVLGMLTDPDEFVQKVRYLYAHQNEKSQEEIQLKDGRTLFRYSAPLIGSDTTYYGRLWLYRDVTTQKQALEEKDFLMKELNHRVKNNLLMVSSLINLKSTALGEEVDLSDIAHQIDTIRLVHEKLHNADQVTSVYMPEYLKDLLDNIFASFTSKKINLSYNVENISLSTRNTVSLGLIINELATNAVKHGFGNEEEPRFSIRFIEETAHNQYVLTIENTGKPFPKEIDIQQPDTFGFQMISALVSQLEGEIDLKREPHPVFTIRFPKNKNI